MHPRALVLIGCCIGVPAAPAAGQIRVHPTGVDVNGHGATTVFLTFGPLGGYRPAEAFWCGDVVDAAPDLGRRCDPSTLFGALPARYDLSRLSGTGGFTDIMSIPPSVTRRAYQAAVAGAVAPFFYVRRFVSTLGGPDQYVAVTCRLTGGGARVPLSLTDVTLAFAVETPVLYVPSGERPASVEARITYTGTGRLMGRWEVVRPGEELPGTRDLLTEAALPLEERGTQRRWAEVGRFNVFLPPTGRVILPGPDPERLPADADGTYLVLLRVEPSDDKEGDSDLAAVGAGSGVVHSGAVAGFPMPTLRYVVGSGGSELSPSRPGTALTLLAPEAGARIVPGRSPVFTWTEAPRVETWRVEIETAGGEPLLAAVTGRGRPAYQAPPWLAERARDRPLRWRVVGLDAFGTAIARSPWRPLFTQ